jgi:hypothetical protein
MLPAASVFRGTFAETKSVGHTSVYVVSYLKRSFAADSYNNAHELAIITRREHEAN